MKYLVLAALLAVPAVASAKTKPAPEPAPVTEFKVGGVIIGKDNQNAGSIAQITDAAVVIDTGTNKVPVPRAAVGINPKGYWIGMTKGELDAAYVQAAQQAQTNFAAQLVPGTMVHGLNGAMLGTIKAADAQGVTITTGKGDVRLPISGVGPGPDNSVLVGLTAEQLDAALAGGAAASTQPKAPGTR